MKLKQGIQYIATFLSGLTIATIYFSSINTLDTIDKIPSSYFTEKKVLDGTITNVIDGDTYNFLSSSSFSLNNLFSNDKKSKGFKVRIAGIDTPETPKKGLPGQKFSLEAKEYAKTKLLNRPIKLKLLKLDRYQRVLGVVKYKDGFFYRNIAEDLLREGLATIYKQGGAEYDNELEKYEYIESTAIKNRKGIWSNGKENAELPSQYKKKIAKTYSNQ